MTSLRSKRASGSSALLSPNFSTLQDAARRRQVARGLLQRAKPLVDATTASGEVGDRLGRTFSVLQAMWFSTWFCEVVFDAKNHEASRHSCNLTGQVKC